MSVDGLAWHRVTGIRRSRSQGLHPPPSVTTHLLLEPCCCCLPGQMATHNKTPHYMHSIVQPQPQHVLSLWFVGGDTLLRCAAAADLSVCGACGLWIRAFCLAFLLLCIIVFVILVKTLLLKHKNAGAGPPSPGCKPVTLLLLIKQTLKHLPSAKQPVGLRPTQHSSATTAKFQASLLLAVPALMSAASHRIL